MDISGGDGGAAWRERLIIVALILIIVGSVAMSFYGILGSGTGDSERREDMHFQCGKCGKPFTRTYAEVAAEAARAETDDDEDPRQMIDCTLCKAKNCAGTMVKCPECGKHFLPFVFAPSPTDSEEVVLGEANNICPHCKTDRLEWFRKDYERRKK